MSTRTKILVVDSDLDTLSRIYLALVHRNFKAEASDKAEEIAERIKRLKPEVLILGNTEYEYFKPKLKLPCIVLVDGENSQPETAEDLIVVKKPVQLDELIRKIETLI